MPRLRHFAIVVRDLEKSAKFYESVFDLKRVGQEKLEFAAAVYLSDGVINLALLNYFGSRGSGLQDAKNFVGAHHFGFQVEDIPEIQRKIESAGGEFFLISAMTRRRRTSSGSSRTRTASFSTYRRRAGWARPVNSRTTRSTGRAARSRRPVAH